MRVEAFTGNGKTYILEEKTKKVVYLGDYRPFSFIINNTNKQIVFCIFTFHGFLEYDNIEISNNNIRMEIKGE